MAAKKKSKNKKKNRASTSKTTNKESFKKQTKQNSNNPKSFLEYNVGEKIFGETIEHIYYAKETHLIYRVENNDGITYAVSNPKGNISSVSEFFIAFNRKLSRRIDKDRFSYKLATVMDLCFEGQESRAIDMGKELRNEVLEYAQNLRSGRVFYLGTAIFILLLAWVIAIFQELFPISNNLASSVGLESPALFGLTGGFISIVYGLNRIDFYYESSKYIFCLTSFSRVIISILAGVILFVLIKSNMALGFLNNENTNPYIILVFATVAGFSESFIPNILTEIETKDIAK